MQETEDVCSTSGWGRSPGEGNGYPYVNILAWRIPWAEEPGGLQFLGSQRVRHNWSDLAHMHTHTTKCSPSTTEAMRWSTHEKCKMKDQEQKLLQVVQLKQELVSSVIVTSLILEKITGINLYHRFFQNHNRWHNYYMDGDMS